jgi:hypothetical protein
VSDEQHDTGWLPLPLGPNVSRRLPVERTPLGGTAYVSCPDYPGVCSHSEGECPADRQAEATRMASFKRIG